MATNWPTSRDTFTNPSSSSTLDSPSHAAQHANINDAVEAMQLYAGLVLVKTQTIGSGVSSVTVTNAFSSTFDNYRIMLRPNTATASVGWELTLGSTTTNYKYAFWAFRWDNTTFTSHSASGTFMYIGAGVGSTPTGASTIDLFGPNVAAATHYVCQSTYAASSDGWTGHGGGIQTDSTQFTAFTIAPSSGTLTGGTIRVYGYNNG